MMEDTTGMRPKMGSSELILPITFDYSGGRRDKNSSAKVWSIVLGVLGVIIGILVMFKGKSFFLINILIGLCIIYGVAFIIRFFLLHEGKYRREFITNDDNKMKLDWRKIWGIYNIGANYPYICRYRNGKSGVIIRLNKDVILGKYSEAEYEHYEAIADAYNIAGGSKIQMCHVDYMSDIGLDERLDYSFNTLSEVSNDDLKDLLTDIYTFQKEQMSERVTTYDVYVFLWKGSDASAWNTIQSILNCLLQANYRSYQVLNENELRLLTQTIFNLEDFSAVDAMLHSFKTDEISRVVPIMVTHSDGSVKKLGKTKKEKEEERELAEKKAEIKKQLKKEGKGKNKQSKKEVENNDFDWDEELNIDEEE